MATRSGFVPYAAGNLYLYRGIVVVVGRKHMVCERESYIKAHCGMKQRLGIVS
jgi:hypothetical protein